jgi:large subunit ribosomal protein L16
MLQPKNQKHRKQFRGKMKGYVIKGSKVTMGEYAIQALGRSWITERQIESARKAIVRETKRKGKLWLKIFPDKPYSKKPAETRMGKGKGDVAGFVAVVQPGRILFELGGVTEEVAKEAFRVAGHKLPIKTQFVARKTI